MTKNFNFNIILVRLFLCLLLSVNYLYAYDDICWITPMGNYNCPKGVTPPGSGCQLIKCNDTECEYDCGQTPVPTNTVLPPTTSPSGVETPTPTNSGTPIPTCQPQDPLNTTNNTFNFSDLTLSETLINRSVGLDSGSSVLPETGTLATIALVSDTGILASFEAIMTRFSTSQGISYSYSPVTDSIVMNFANNQQTDAVIFTEAAANFFAAGTAPNVLSLSGMSTELLQDIAVVIYYKNSSDNMYYSGGMSALLESVEFQINNASETKPSFTELVTNTPPVCPTATPTTPPLLSPSPIPSKNVVASVSPSPSSSRPPAISPSASPSSSPANSPSSSSTTTPSNSISASVTPSVTPSMSTTRSASPSLSASPSISVIASSTPSSNASEKPSISATSSVTPSVSSSIASSTSPTPSITASSSSTPSISVTPTSSPSQSPFNTPSVASSASSSPTRTITSTPTASASATSQASPNATKSQSPIPTMSASPSSSPKVNGPGDKNSPTPTPTAFNPDNCTDQVSTLEARAFADHAAKMATRAIGQYALALAKVLKNEGNTRGALTYRNLDKVLRNQGVNAWTFIHSGALALSLYTCLDSTTLCQLVNSADGLKTLEGFYKNFRDARKMIRTEFNKLPTSVQMTADRQRIESLKRLRIFLASIQKLRKELENKPLCSELGDDDVLRTM